MLHKKYENRGFTLVELLSVIVILAIILVIAVPKIMSVITDSKKSSLETSAKMIASSAEKIKLQNKLLGKENDTITCDSIAKISSKDYSNCTITFNNNEAIVSINGIGKFNGINVCNATKNKAETSEEKCPTDGRFFAYDTIFDESNLDEDAFVYSAEVIDMDKCVNFIVDEWEYSNEKAQAICNNDVENGNGWNLQQNASSVLYTYVNMFEDISSIKEAGFKGTYKKITNVEITNKDTCITYLTNAWGERFSSTIELNCNGEEDLYGHTIKDYIRMGRIPVTDFETAGLIVSMENYKTYTIITGYDISGGENVVIPKEIDGYKVDEILNYALYNEDIKSIEVPKTITKINDCAFGDKTRLTSSNISSSYTCNNKPTNGALTLVNKMVNNDILNSYAQYNDTTYHAGIRYIGEEPNNYVYFNCDDNSDTSTCEIWRIIGVFNIDGEERIKIINTSSTFTASWDSSDSTINLGRGINQWGESTYEDGTIYDGADLYQLLNGFYVDTSKSCTYCLGFNQSKCSNTCTESSLINENMKPLTNNAKKFIGNATWYTYAVEDEDYGYIYSGRGDIASNVYLQEIGIKNKYTGDTCKSEDEDYCNDTVIRTASTVAQVGIMSIGDILYSDVWLNNGDITGKWPLSITPDSDYNNVVWQMPSYHFSQRLVGQVSYIYPSVYLKSNVNLNGTGDDLGSINNPYTLSID